MDSESFVVPAVQSSGYNADADNCVIVLQTGKTETEQIISDE